METEKKGPGDRTQEFLNRIREKKNTGKKKAPSFLVLLNVFVLFIVIMYHLKTAPEKQAFVSVIRYDEIEYRLSVTDDEEAKTLLCVVTATNKTDNPVSARYLNDVAQVTIKHVDISIQSATFGAGTSVLTLNAKESRAFLQNLGGDSIRNFAHSHPDYTSPRRRSFFSPGKKHIPLTAEFFINTKNRVSTELNFKYYIE